MSVNDLATLGHLLDLRQLSTILKPLNTLQLLQILLPLQETVLAIIEFLPMLQKTKLMQEYKTIGNAANQHKVGRYVDLTTTTGSGVYGWCFRFND
jgi:hypothetical protein